MKYIDVASTKQILVFSLAFVMLFSGVSIGATNAFADDNAENDFVTFTNVNLNDPMIAKILENIEKSKKGFSDIKQKTNQEKFLDDQRSIAKDKLEQELEQMLKDNEEFTSLATFNNFLKKVSDDNTKTVFQGLFDYKQNKVNAARDAMHEVLRDGGSLQDALDAYHEAAKIPRIDMIQLVKDLNIKVGFSDPDIQNHFDDDGKLPRYDDEQESILSFVDLTTTAKSVNSSTNSAEIQETIQAKTFDEFREWCEPQFGERCAELYEKRDVVETETLDDVQTSDDILIQQLLEEIQVFKNRIQELEKKQDYAIQRAVFGQQDPVPIQYADLIPDYSQETIQAKTFDEFREWCEPQFGERCAELYEKRDVVETETLDDVQTSDDILIQQLLEENQKSENENRGLKIENNQLNNQIDSLNSEIDSLNNQIVSMSDEFVKMLTQLNEWFRS